MRAGPRLLEMRERRYPSDTSDTEWALLEPLLPPPACTTPTGGHPEKWPRREIADGIRYLVDNGIKWRAMPADFPPWRTSDCRGRHGHRRSRPGRSQSRR